MEFLQLLHFYTKFYFTNIRLIAYGIYFQVLAILQELELLLNL